MQLKALTAEQKVELFRIVTGADYKDMIEFIVASLEEREREETFRLKWLKTKMTKAQSA